MPLLKPEVSVPVALGTAGVVAAVFANALPTVADIRVADTQNRDVYKSVRLATWTSAGVVSGISLIARDPMIFIVGGAMTVALAWWHLHANAVNPLTGTALLDALPGRPKETQEQAPTEYGYTGQYG